MLQQDRRAHVRLTLSLFSGLGAQVGVFAVLIPELAAARGLGPGALGRALAVMSAAAIVTLAAAGRLADRRGPRPLALAGTGGFALAFALLALVPAVWPSLVVYGVASGCLDLAANATGARVERLHGMRAMVSFHAGFSGAACASALAVSAALAAGATAPAAYGAAAAGYVALAAALVRARFPEPHAPEPVGGEPPARAPESSDPAGAAPLLRTPGVAVAVVLCTVCFFGDSAIEGFAALVLREAAGASAPLAGAGLAAFHGASLLGRLALARVGARRALVGGGLGAAAGTLLVLFAPAPAVSAAGLLLVGFALAPVIPTTLSLAARAAPARSGAAVSLVTSVGYSAFLAGPPLVGALGQATSLRATLAPVVVSTLALAAIGATARSVRHEAPALRDSGA